jgi:glycerol uptake operon antiterminator
MFELQNPVIAAVRKDVEFESAVNSPVSVIFMLKADVMTLKDVLANKKDKKVFVHIDMADGVGKDKKGIELLKSLGVDGIITTKNHLVYYAKEQGLYTVQRFFIIDSASIATALESINNTKPDYAELLPGIMPRVVTEFVEKTQTPIIAGGLIKDKTDIISVLSAGAEAVSTAKKELWNI